MIPQSIIKFEHTQYAIYYTLDERTGNYVKSGNTTRRDIYNEYPEIAHYNDFLTNGDFKIFQVKDKLRNLTFILGGVYTYGTGRFRIASIKFSNGKIVFNNDTLMSTVTYITQPIVQPEVQPETPRTALPNPGSLTASSGNKITDIQTKIIALPDIRIRKVLKKRNENLTEFLVKFFTKFNLENDTIFVDSEEIQTAMGKRRSLGDIYKICKYYYPKCTLEEVMRLLYNQTSPLFQAIPTFRSSYCSTINKRVWYVGSQGAISEILNTSTNDEYGNNYNTYKQLLNIN